MSLDSVTSEEKAKLKQLVDEGCSVLQEVDDLKGGLRDTVKAIAEELDIKPSVLNKAISLAHKANLQGAKQDFEDVETATMPDRSGLSDSYLDCPSRQSWMPSSPVWISWLRGLALMRATVAKRSTHQMEQLRSAPARFQVNRICFCFC